MAREVLSRRSFLKRSMAAAAYAMTPDALKVVAKAGEWLGGDPHQETRVSPELEAGVYYYGFIKVPEPVKFLRTGPSFEQYGTFKHWLGNNSFMRFEKSENPDWVTVVRDDDTNSFLPTIPRKVKAYMPLDKIELVNPADYSTPIDYVTKPENQFRKFVVVEKRTRLITLFEGDTAIAKMPAFINDELTPFGVHQVYKRKLQANMPSVYGVGPGIASLEVYGRETGFALHGSRGWRDWPNITYEELLRKDTHGCMNLPSWDDLDVFTFRWLGGQANPESQTLELVDDGPHVFIVERLSSLKNLEPTREVTEAGYGSWDEVVEKIEAIPVNAPKHFWEPEKK